MQLATRKGLGGRRIVRFAKPLFGANYGYDRMSGPFVEIQFDGQDGVNYQVRLTPGDLDRLNASMVKNLAENAEKIN